ncbi:MAG: urea ABC transporter permease subunit UrtC, partial [Burkholderiaceae bacterium]
MKTSLFSRPAWTGIIVCAAILALLPILNLIFAPGHVLHISSYTVALIGKFMCYAMAALA